VYDWFIYIEQLQVAGCCEHCDEPSHGKRCDDFFFSQSKEPGVGFLRRLCSIWLVS